MLKIKNMETTAKKIVFSGRVQGVGFRFTAYNSAKRFNLTGYVRNLPDGSVEMIAQGSDNDITTCIDDIKCTLSDYIKNVNIQNIPSKSDYREFKITF